MSRSSTKRRKLVADDNFEALPDVRKYFESTHIFTTADVQVVFDKITREEIWLSLSRNQLHVCNCDFYRSATQQQLEISIAEKQRYFDFLPRFCSRIALWGGMVQEQSMQNMKGYDDSKSRSWGVTST